MVAGLESLPCKEPLMSATPFRRLALFTLALALATPWLVMAAPHPVAKGAIQAPSAPSSLLSLWSGWLTRLWADAGCIIDPDGRCVTGPRTDAGCIGDPNGGCKSGQ